MITITMEEDDLVELALPDGFLDKEEEKDPYVSKIGGKPTMLFPSQLVDQAEGIKCSNCKSVMYLLLQMDSPDIAGVDRIIYLFVCNTRECTESSTFGVAVALIQCQKAIKKPTKPTLGLWDSLQSAINDATKTLTELNLDADQEDTNRGIYSEKYPVSFPTVGLHVVDELISIKPNTIKTSKSNDNSEMMVDADGWNDEGYERMNITGYDKTFKAFHTKVAYYPRQCARYSPNGKALFFNSDPLPKVKTCSKCNQDRHFDLQLMPAVLSKLPVNDNAYLSHIPKEQKGKHPLFGDGMEWGTILVYTCGICSLSNDAINSTNFDNTSPSEKPSQCEFFGQVLIQIEKDQVI